MSLILYSRSHQVQTSYILGLHISLKCKHPKRSLLAKAIMALEEVTAAHFSILAWRIPWTEEPGGLQSIGLQSRTRLKQLSTQAYLPCTHSLLSSLLLSPQCARQTMKKISGCLVAKRTLEGEQNQTGKLNPQNSGVQQLISKTMETIHDY